MDQSAEEGERRQKHTRRHLPPGVHVGFAVALAVVCGVTAVYGWGLKPPPSGFPVVPRGMTIAVPAEGPVRNALETLTRTKSNGARLELWTRFSLPSWTVTISKPGTAELCRPQRTGRLSLTTPGGLPEGIYVEHQTWVRKTRDSAEVHGEGEIYLQLCWSSHAPVSLSGSFLSAQFPPVQGSGCGEVSGFHGGDRSASVTRLLDPSVGDTASFNVQQSLTLPTESRPTTWLWESVLQGLCLPPDPTNPAGVLSGPVSTLQQNYFEISQQQPVALSAIDVNGTQQDSQDALLCGIFLGVAGAALIALIQELVNVARALHEKKP